MAEGSNIEWTGATWNPATGCSKISPGCTHCYASPLSKRLQRMGQTKYKNGFEYTEHHNELDKPDRWKKPRYIFVNSMSDLFHEKATFPFIEAVFETMLRVSRHRYQILTKRPGIMRNFINHWLVKKDLAIVPSHIWLGVSVENADYEHRIGTLRCIPAYVRFVSFEPLLGSIKPNLDGIHWAIVGGESGRGARPVNESWIRMIQEACRIYGVPFFFKQWGGRYPTEKGRELDGKTYNEMPRIGTLA